MTHGERGHGACWEVRLGNERVARCSHREALLSTACPLICAPQSNADLGSLQVGDRGASWAVRDGARDVALLRLASATAPTRRKPCEPIIEAIE